MTSFGAKKYDVIFFLCDISGLGFTTAKAMVESVPTRVKVAASKENAETFKAQLEKVGATVKIKHNRQSPNLSDIVKTDVGAEKIKDIKENRGITVETGYNRQPRNRRFDVVMTDVGVMRFRVRRLLYNITRLGFPEIEDLIEGAVPFKVMEAVSGEDAEAIKARLEKVGATVEIRKSIGRL